MSYEIRIKKQVDKFLIKLAKFTPHEFDKIDYFIKNVLSTNDNPCLLPNAKHLQGFDDNRYRWRIGEYRIIGIVKNGEFKIIEVVNIARKK